MGNERWCEHHGCCVMTLARVPRLVQPQCCSTETLHKENVRLRSFDSSKQKCLAVRRNRRASHNRYLGQIRDFPDTPCDKIVVIYGSMSWRASNEVDARRCQRPFHVGGHSRDLMFIAAVHGRGPDLVLFTYGSEKEHAVSIR